MKGKGKGVGKMKGARPTKGTMMGASISDSMGRNTGKAGQPGMGPTSRKSSKNK